MGNITPFKRYLSILVIGLSPSVFAVDEYEREELSRLLNELNYLDNIIVVAKNSGGEHGREQFDYTALEQDIQRIKNGIAQYLNTTKRDPRSVKKISGEYSVAR